MIFLFTEDLNRKNSIGFDDLLICLTKTIKFVKINKFKDKNYTN